MTNAEPFDARLIQVLNCPLCSFMSKRIGPYVSHLHGSHNERITVDIYMCTACGLKSTHKDLLEDHAALDHTEAQTASVESLTHLVANSGKPTTESMNPEICLFCLHEVELMPDTKQAHYASFHGILDISAFSIYQCRNQSAPLQSNSEPLPTPAICQVLCVKNEPVNDPCPQTSHFEPSTPSTRNANSYKPNDGSDHSNQPASSGPDSPPRLSPITTKSVRGRKSRNSAASASVVSKVTTESSSKKSLATESAKKTEVVSVGRKKKTPVDIRNKQINSDSPTPNKKAPPPKKKISVKVARKSRTRTPSSSSDSQEEESTSDSTWSPSTALNDHSGPTTKGKPRPTKGAALAVSVSVPPVENQQQSKLTPVVSDNTSGVVSPEVEGEIKCPDCPRMFKTAASMRIHNSLTHWRITTNDTNLPLVPVKDDEPLFECPTCSRRFMRRSGLEAHLIRTHNIPPDEAQMHADSISCRIYSIDSLGVPAGNAKFVTSTTTAMDQTNVDNDNTSASNKRPPETDVKVETPAAKKQKLSTEVSSSPKTTNKSNSRHATRLSQNDNASPKLRSSSSFDSGKKSVAKKESPKKPASPRPSPGIKNSTKNKPLTKKLVYSKEKKKKTVIQSKKSPVQKSKILTQVRLEVFMARKSTGGVPKVQPATVVTKRSIFQKDGFIPMDSSHDSDSLPLEDVAFPPIRPRSLDSDDLEEAGKYFNSCALCSKQLPDTSSFMNHMIEEHSEVNRSGGKVSLNRENLFINNPPSTLEHATGKLYLPHL